MDKDHFCLFSNYMDKRLYVQARSARKIFLAEKCLFGRGEDDKSNRRAFWRMIVTVNKVLITAIFLLFSAMSTADGSYDDSYLSGGATVDAFDEAMRSDMKQHQDSGNVVYMEAAGPFVDLSRDKGVLKVEPSDALKREQKSLEMLKQAQAELKRAREVRRRAEREEAERRRADDIRSSEMELAARKRAEIIEGRARAQLARKTLDPVLVMTENVSMDAQSATISEIASAIMPSNWEVRTDFHNKPDIEHRRYMFTTTQQRDVALRELLGSVTDARVTHQYMWDLVNEKGEPAPVLIISDRK